MSASARPPLLPRDDLKPDKGFALPDPIRRLIGFGVYISNDDALLFNDEDIKNAGA
ncbi:MAG: hypothetical protein ABI481_10980 [Pyrinomonadaceae bacterium]